MKKFCRAPRVGMLLIALLLIGGCDRAIPLEHQLLRCGGRLGAIRDGGVCELPQQSSWMHDRTLSVLIAHPDPDPSILLEGGLIRGNESRPRVAAKDHQRLLTIHVDKNIDRVVIRVSSATETRRVAIIPIASYEISPELERAFSSLSNHAQPDVIKRQLEQAAIAGSLVSQARARRHLAKLLLDGDSQQGARNSAPIQRAVQLHREASQFASGTGEIWDEAWNLLNHAALLQKYLQQSAEAKRILDSSRLANLAALMPGLHPWLALYRSEVLANAEPYHALAAVQEGLESARLYIDKSAVEQLCRQRSVLLFAMGRAVEARQSCDEPAEADDCRRVYNLLAKAQIQLMEMEETHRRDLDPRPNLSQGLELLKSNCPGSGAKQAAALIYQARAALLAEDEASISEDELASLPRSQDPELYAELLAVRAELALLRRPQAPGESRRLFQELRIFAEPLGLHVFAWRALIGLARSYEQEAPAQAVRMYEDALRLLAEWAEQLPLGLGHGSFLGRHEEGLRRYVDFLLRQRQFARAFEVIRQTRTLGLRVLMLTRQIEGLEASIRESLFTARRDFEKARLDRDAGQMTRLRGEILQILSKSVGAPVFSPLPPPPPLAVGEAIFTCYPVFSWSHRTGEKDWACFAARAGGDPPIVERVGPIDPMRSDRQLAQQILGPFRELLAAAQVVRVLEYGVFAQIPVHLLPLSDTVRLGDQRSVVYALDLPMEARPALRTDFVQRGALAILNPSKEPEHEALTRCPELPLRIEPFAGPLSIPQAGGLQEGRIIEMLSRSSFFYYAGHAKFDERDATYGLVLSPERRLSAGMLLSLPRAPAFAVLIGCSTGSTQVSEGDGVALGVAQPLLVRGAHEVLGTSRVIPAHSGATVACKIFKHFSPRNSAFPLAAALQQTFKEPQVAALGTHELGAFRSYVP